jgi:type I restriction-modification system DNA methylase subunit
MEVNRFHELLKVADNSKPVFWGIYDEDVIMTVYPANIKKAFGHKIELYSYHQLYLTDLYETEKEAILALLNAQKIKAKEQIEEIINNVEKVYQQHGLAFNRNMLLKQKDLPVVNLVNLFKRVDEDGYVYYYREDGSLAGECDQKGGRIFTKYSYVCADYRQLANESDLIEMYEKFFNCVVNVIS